MRPIYLELEGFSVYRSKVDVDLRKLAESDVAFFSLTGATGSGKSSLIDAMIFALYGRIPRLGARAVAPVISSGADRARVRLDFEIDGEVYTAVRLAQRGGSGGASVKEARLQHGDRVLSSGADNVTRAVEDLLNLGFDDFTRTVVLPQGEFARFLNATSGERQSLLRGLLGLDVYGKVRQLATNRQAVAEALVENARHKLDEIEVPTPEAMESLKTRLEKLESLERVVAEAERGMVALEKEGDAAEADVNRLGESVARLECLKVPDRLEELAGMVGEALARVGESEDAVKESIERVKAIETAMAALPEPESIARDLANHKTLQEVEARIAEIDLEKVRTHLATAETGWAGVREEHDRLRQDRDALRMSHSAHALAATLTDGEACPVCQQEVTALPQVTAPPGMKEIEDQLVTATARLGETEAAMTQARAAATGLETTHADLMARRDELIGHLTGVSNGEELEQLEARHNELRAELVEARAETEKVESALESAKRGYEDLASDQRQMSKLLRAAQQTVADLGPPISESDDVVVEWKELLAWRDETLTRVLSEHTGAVERSVEIKATLERSRSDLIARLETVGLAAADSFQAALAAETERARNTLAGQRQALDEVESLDAAIEEGAVAASVAKSLADHLRAGRFEQWIMAGALEALVAGANGLLAELSDRGYSLHSEEGAFSIVDHRNADQVRPVSTLSGGETFLVSLALALSLAETHASEGDARLDAVILDEGFGTLDDETLDTAASVLEELARNRGLMVGVISHVKELAERATVRFEVTRGPKGSTVSELT